MKKLATCVVAIISLIGTCVFAADMATKAPPPPPSPVFSWTGFYIGGNIGGTWAYHNVGIVPNDPAAQAYVISIGGNGGNFVPALSFGESGVIIGLQLGYNWQFNRNWLIGLETDFNWTDLKGSAGAQQGGVIGGVESFEERVKWFGTVRARLGYLPVDNLLAFVTGGLAYGEIEHTANLTQALGFGLSTGTVGFQCPSGLPCFAGSSNETKIGWTVGGGVEYAFWQRWTVKAEYLYVNLTSDMVTTTATAPSVNAPNLSSFSTNYSRPNVNVVRVGLNYQFH